MVDLVLVPDKRQQVIAVGTSIRKSATILRHYLASLAAQELPPNTRLLPIFVLDGADAEARALIFDWTRQYEGAIIGEITERVQDFDDNHPDSHQWSESAMVRVGANKDRIIAEARRLGVDALWFCDADLICDTTTLKSLLAAPGPITTAVYWTRWSARAIETQQVHAAPQVWLRHPYDLKGAGYEEHEFRALLASRQLLKVAGYGACTLIQKRALDNGASFAPVDGVPRVGLMAGEDRQFCIRAQQLHLDGWADAWPDIFHIYHPTDVAKAPEYAARLSAPHADRANFGDLVNLTIAAIEPVPWQGGGFTGIPPQYVRGRLGALPLAPELEEAVYELKRGESKIVPVHFPAHYEVPFYRGKRRLIRVTLNDAKPLCWSPNLEDEVLRGVRAGSAMHARDYTQRQLTGMVANG